MGSPQQQSALNTLLDAQQDRSSPSFHNWLSPEEFGRQFGPSDQDIQAVTSWLESHGLQVDRVALGRTVIEFSGTAGQVFEAFHTEVHKFAVNGEEHWANASDPQIPAAMAPVVAGVAKLHNFRAKSMSVRSPKLNSGFQPEYNEPSGSHALSPADYAVIYNIKPLYQAGINGTGVTIGVIGVAPVLVSDVNDFRRAFGLSKNPPQVVVNGTSPDYWQPDQSMTDLEGTLDLSWAGAIAPNATVKFIVSAPTDTSPDNLDLSEQYAVDNNVADILTESFSTCEADLTKASVQLSNSIRAQAAAQGITYLVSSGDSGPYTCYGESFKNPTGPLSINALAASPYVVAVGGTEFSGSILGSTYWATANKTPSLASALSYIPENVWNDSCDAAHCGVNNVTVASSGGGVSKFFTKPSWQAGVAGIPADGARDVPDVSLTASPNVAPYLLCYAGSCTGTSITSNSFATVGGTSASAPAFAAVMALVVQKTKSRQGQANYVLYRLAASEQYSKCNGSNTKTLPDSKCIFQDITTGNNAIPGEPKYNTPGSLYQAGPGYDLATGLGSINVANLVNRWESVTFNATTTSLAMNPTTLRHGDAANVQITVAPQSGSGTPAGDVALVIAGAPGAGPFSLSSGSVTTTANSLPGGTYSVSAHYTGDGVFAPSDSSPVSLTVSPEPSITSAGALATLGLPNAFYSGGIYGSDYLTLSARVAGRSAQGAPTGKVVFTDNAAPIAGGSGAVNTEGQALSTNSGLVLPPGQHSIVATYSGDASFQASSSPPAAINITTAPSTISVQPSLSQVQSGKSVSLMATIETGFSPFGDPQTGAVTFFLGGKQLQKPVPVASTFDLFTGNQIGAATLTTSTLPSGPNSITATYSGDHNYMGSNSQPVTVTVSTKTPACAVTTFTADPNPITLFDAPATTMINVAAPCQFDVRTGSTSGKLLGTGTGKLSVFAGSVTDGTTFYLQSHADTTPQGTLEKLTVHAQSGVLPCVVFSFAATPNPIVSPTLVGTTTITVFTSCNFDVRVSSPNGNLFGSGEYVLVVPTANWVTNGMEFFLQQRGNTTPQGTLATLSVAVASP